MKTLPIDDHNQGIFPHKLGYFFPIFKKGQGRPPLPPRSRYAPAGMVYCNHSSLVTLLNDAKYIHFYPTFQLHATLSH